VIKVVYVDEPINWPICIGLILTMIAQIALIVFFIVKIIQIYREDRP
jgi:hypothetical protein